MVKLRNDKIQQAKKEKQELEKKAMNSQEKEQEQRDKALDEVKKQI